MTGAQQLDLDNCATEPIRIPGGIQPFGALLVLDPETLVLRQASASAAEMLGVAMAPGEPVPLAHELADWVRGGVSTLLRTVSMPTGPFQVSGHRAAQGTILEFELPTPDEGVTIEGLYPRLQAFADTLLPLEDLHAMGAAATAEIRAMTGYDRVMLYSFNADWHGTVLSESRNEALPSYLDLRFPASDIPAQARELYRLNPVRSIPDANYTPVPILPTLSPVDGKPLDLSFAALRSVSPIHLQYMRNMGTLGSMSVSIIVEDRLWGLISCHSVAPRRVAAHIRSACNFVAKLLSLQISSVERGRHAAERIALKRRETELVAQLSRAPSLPDALAANAKAWLSLANATGAAVVTAEGISTAGETPPPAALQRITDWLRANTEGTVFSTDSLARHWPEAELYADTASGLLAVPISQLHSDFVMWFRPEVVRTVTWGGDPRKSADPLERLTPRSSFAQWREEVRLRALPWSRAEEESAADFQSALINFVLRRAEERAELTEELERSNKELEAFSYSISHDLRAPFRHIVGYSELLSERETALDETSRHYLKNIVGAALSAGRLVDDLLRFSQLGRANLNKTRVDMNKLVTEIRRSAEPDIGERRIEWQVDDLPVAFGDMSLLRQAFTNLVDNAIKYSRDRDPAIITIGGETRDGVVTYWVKDNGVGFEMAYVDKLFGVFQRLHRMEEFAGTGIGLALTKRIIDRHGGVVSAEGQTGQGATFTIRLPQDDRKLKHA